MTARDEMLARIRRATPATAPVPIPRNYHGAGEVPCPDPVALFAERVGDYRATVLQCTRAEVPIRVGTVLQEHGRRRVVVPSGFPEAWLDGVCGAAEVSVLSDEPPLSWAELDAADGVVTSCACAIAVTGTIVLDHGAGQGRRALTLLPDFHLVVVDADQIVAAVPDAIARIVPSAPLTWISGPSATSDIELDRVEGVHGPRTLVVLVAV